MASPINMAPGRSIGSRRLWIPGLVLLVLTAGFYFARRSGSDYRIYSNDFNVYYFAAREIMAGHDPYTASLGPSTTYLYPPLLAEVMIPLAMLPLPLAAYVWFLASAASWLIAVTLCARMATDNVRQGNSPAPGQRHVLLVGALSTLVLLRFTLDTFDMGQVNAIVVCLSVAHVYLFTRGRRAMSASALALAVAVKLWPVLLILYHVARGRIRFAAACSALIAAVMLASFVAAGPDAGGSIKLFYSRTIKNEQGFDLTYSGNQSLRAAIGRIVGESDGKSGGDAQSPSPPVAVIASLILLLLAIFVSRSAVSEIGAAAPFFCAMVLISPLAWKNHFVMLLLPIACLAGTAVMRTAESPSWGTLVRRASACALALTFLLFNFTSPKLIGLGEAEWADAHSFVTLGGLVVLVALGAISILRRSNRRSNAN